VGFGVGTVVAFVVAFVVGRVVAIVVDFVAVGVDVLTVDGVESSEVHPAKATATIRIANRPIKVINRIFISVTWIDLPIIVFFK